MTKGLLKCNPLKICFTWCSYQICPTGIFCFKFVIFAAQFISINTLFLFSSVALSEYFGVELLFVA